jgi:hypothetical protein
MPKRSSLILVIAGLLLMETSILGEVLDRIVVIIDNAFIITLSDIRKERAIQSAFGRQPGDDETVANDLVEKHLIEQQIVQFREIEVSEAAVEERLRAVRRPASVSDKEFRETVVGELRVNDFMNERFRQFIRVSDEELMKYYEETFVPALRLRGEPVPPPEQGMEAVRQNVIVEKMNKEVDSWMAELKRRSSIEKIP